MEKDKIERPELRERIITLLTTKWCSTDPAFCLIADKMSCDECLADRILALIPAPIEVPLA